MFSTRKQVDEHVYKIFGKVVPGPERDLKGLAIAKLYYKIQEYSKVIDYLTGYLKVRDDSFAHKLMANAYKLQKVPDLKKALQHYQRCIQINAKQPDIIKEACQVLLDDNSVFNEETAKFWCEIADQQDVAQLEEVFAVKLKLMKNDSVNVDDENILETRMLKEVRSRPKDVAIRISLLRCFLEKNKLEECFSYAFKTQLEFKDSLPSDWYDVVWTVQRKLEQAKDAKKDWLYWYLTLHSLERLVYLSLSGSESKIGSALSSTRQLLFRFDQHLHKFREVVNRVTDNVQVGLHQYFLEHSAGQLLLHTVSLLCKRELVSNSNKWRDVLRTALPVMLLGYQLNPFKSGKSSQWIRHCDASQKELVEVWRQEAAFRCAQLGRTLHGCLRNEDQLSNGNQESTLWGSSDELLSFVRQICADKLWRRQVYQTIYTHSDQKLKEENSLLVCDSLFQEPLYEWPQQRDIEDYEQQSLALAPHSLPHHVYLCLESSNLSDVPHVTYYSGMNEDIKQNLSYCGAETISKVDVDVFLYAVTLQTQRKLQLMRENYDSFNMGNRSATAKPRMLPYVNIVSHLATEEQIKWWTLAYKLHQNDVVIDNRVEQRMQLQCGLEAVRGVNGPRADIYIVLKLGQLLEGRSSVAGVDLEPRIEMLYRRGLTMLKLQQQQQLEPFKRYFSYGNSDSSAVWKLVHSTAEDSVSYLATRSFKRGSFNEFIDEMCGLQLPMATYMMAEAYRRLQESKRPTLLRSVYLEHRQECLEQTQQLLRSQADHPLAVVVDSELRHCNQESAASAPRNGDSFYSPDQHNNSSTYEDAEDGVYSQAPQNRSRRALEANPPAPAPAPVVITQNNLEVEQTVKHMSKELCTLKEHVSDNMSAMRQELKALSDKFSTLEDLLKKCRISTSRETPTTEVESVAAAAAALGLDEFLIMEESLDQQHQQQQHQAHTQHQQQVPGLQSLQSLPAPAFAGGYFNGSPAPGNAFNNPMFNQNQVYNYYNGGQWRNQTPPQPQVMPHTNLFGSRNSNSFGMPNMYTPPQAYLDSNFGMGLPPAIQVPPQPSLIPPAVPIQSVSVESVTVPAPLPAVQESKSGVQVFGQAKPPVVQSQPQLQSQTQPQLSTPNAPTTMVFNKALNNQPVEKEPPANVVITSSDPLPKPVVPGNTVVANQPTLSVTIPAQHIKPSVVQANEIGAQIPAAALPTGSGFNFKFNSGTSLTTPTGNIFGATTTEKPSSSTAPSAPITSTFVDSSAGFSAAAFSFKDQVARAAIDKQKELEEAAKVTSSQNKSDNSDVNKSFGADASAELDYDPRPDFQGIIPLPDEIEVRTGEEEETVIFDYRAKLFRLLDKEWKDRGVGQIKILKGKQGQFRLVMRRDQTFKICANHFITKQMKLSAPEMDKSGASNSFIWGAPDYADGETRLEKFLVRFKLPETAQQFKVAFDKARNETIEKIEESLPTINGNINSTPSAPGANKAFEFGKSNWLGSSFITSTPAPHATSVATESAKSSLFAKADEKTKVSSELKSKTTFGSLAAATAAAEPSQTPKPKSNFENFSFGSSSKPIGSSPFANLSFGGVSNIVDKSTTDSTLQQQNKSDAEDEFEPTQQFVPVIALPELIETKTGEEEEDILFEHRGKLLRFDAGEWKERGLGIMKLLQRKGDPTKVRLVMRREKIHKVCCNQHLRKDTIFTYLKNSTTALSWAGMDSSDEEITLQKLCIRFKLPETCKEFHEAVLKAQAALPEIYGEGSNSTTKEVTTVPALTATAAAAAEPKGFGDAFKPKAGSWSCSGCYVSNGAEALYCSACETPKDDTVPPKQPQLTQSNALNLSSSASKFSFGFTAINQGKEETSKPTFSFGVQPAAQAQALTPAAAPKSSEVKGFGDAFKPKPGSWNCSACYVSNNADSQHCSACETPKDGSVPKKEQTLGGGNSGISLPATTQFKFGFGKTETASGGAAATETSAATPFSFAGLKDGNKSALSSVASTQSESGGLFSSSSFSFPAPVISSTTLFSTTTAPSTLGSTTFKFTMPKVPQPSDSQPSTVDIGASGDGDDVYHEEENTSYFAPVIPLPDKVDVKTGEENEDLLYIQRAKLYRLVDGEWKERAIGNVKILRHKQTQKLRVLMRREKVHKICLNHVLNKCVAYKDKDEKSLLFVVHDFSEGENVLERFTLRFKLPDIAQQFRDAVKSALDGTAEPIAEPDPEINTSNNNTSISNSTNATITSVPDDIKALANKLKLSSEFLLADNKCSGCRGCDPDKFPSFPTPPPEESSNDRPALPLTLPALSMPKPSESSLPASNANTSSSSLMKPAALFGSVGSTSNEQQSITSGFASFGGFGKTPAVATTTPFSFANSSADNTTNSGDSKPTKVTTQAPSSGSFVFGNAFDKPVFGQSTMSFGNAAPIGQSIFGGNIGTSSAPSIFSGSPGSQTNPASTTSSLFTGTVTSTASMGGQINTPSLFSSQTNAPSTTSLFAGTGSAVNVGGQNNSLTSPSLFSGSGSGQNVNSSGYVFGSISDTASPKPTFGSLNQESSTHVFGDISKSSVPTENKENTALNIKPNQSGFSDLASKATVDFASLAAKSDGTGFQKTSTGFFGLTHQDAFKNFKPAGHDSSAPNLSGSLETTDETYDPHYDPIIALPEEIALSTGEEDEDKLFGERATIYRYDDQTKQWKERGVGELKILQHRERKTFRMIMRREQIHKLVLNMSFGEGFQMKYMNEAKTSFIWAGNNYVEDTNGKCEKLACRFKKLELADKFFQVVNNCTGTDVQQN